MNEQSKMENKLRCSSLSAFKAMLEDQIEIFSHVSDLVKQEIKTFNLARRCFNYFHLKDEEKKIFHLFSCMWHLLKLFLCIKEL